MDNTELLIREFDRKKENNKPKSEFVIKIDELEESCNTLLDETLYQPTTETKQILQSLEETIKPMVKYAIEEYAKFEGASDREMSALQDEMNSIISSSTKLSSALGRSVGRLQDAFKQINMAEKLVNNTTYTTVKRKGLRGRLGGTEGKLGTRAFTPAEKKLMNDQQKFIGDAKTEVKLTLQAVKEAIKTVSAEVRAVHHAGKALKRLQTTTSSIAAGTVPTMSSDAVIQYLRKAKGKAKQAGITEIATKTPQQISQLKNNTDKGINSLNKAIDLEPVMAGILAWMNDVSKAMASPSKATGGVGVGAGEEGGKVKIEPANITKFGNLKRDLNQKLNEFRRSNPAQARGGLSQVSSSLE